MAEQERPQRKSDRAEETQATEDVESTTTEAAEELTDRIDDLLDEIDTVLEENAEEFVKNYVQKGGQ
ncbi:MAG: ubiquitin-like protein Pup [Acidimicrobiia bacterium]|nr:MAG: ubiquitin-like protein Pup [Acidimicrobiia bacterium]